MFGLRSDWYIIRFVEATEMFFKCINCLKLKAKKKYLNG